MYVGSRLCLLLLRNKLNPMWSIISFIILLCFLPIIGFGQKILFLSGEIKNPNGIPIPQAIVTIENSIKGTLADNNGKYSLEITPGQHTILVTAYGYNIQQEVIDISNSKSQNFTLQELTIDISTINVSGKTKSQKIREGSFTVNSIKIKGVASCINNVNSLVGRSSGIKVRENGGVGSDFDISINGLSGNSVRYFIDGVPLSSIGNGVSLANLPVNIVERIEIYKGVVPINLGSDALGGAINIITKKNVKNYIDASYGLGSFGTHKVDFNSQYTNPKSALFIQPSVGVNYSKNNYTMKNVEVRDGIRFKKVDAKRFHDDYLSFITQLKIGVTDKKWADLFSISTSYFYSDKELQTGSLQTWVYGMATRKMKSFNISGQYKKNEFFIKGLSVNMSISQTSDYKIVTDTVYRQYYWDGSYSQASGNEISGGVKSIRNIERPLTIARANFSYSIKNKHVFNINYLLNYLKNNRSDNLDSEFEPTKDIFSKQIIGISYSQQFWTDNLNNTFFLKDYISYLEIGQDDKYWITGSDIIEKITTANNIGYGFSSRMRFFDQIAIKGSYEHCVRLPLAREYLGNGTSIDPNFKLNPENSENINAGFFGTFHLTPKHSLYYETGLFYREVKDYIRYVPDQNEGNGQYDNVKNVTVKGVEGELIYSFNNAFQFIANFTFLDERNKTKYKDDGKPDISYNNRMPNRPWLFSNVEFNYRIKNVFNLENNQLKFSYSYQYVHSFLFTWEQYGTQKAKIPTQHVNNLQLSYSLKNEKYNISLECNNIFNNSIYDNFYMQKPERSFFCKLRIFINQ